MPGSFRIEFDYTMQEALRTIHLVATVENGLSKKSYSVCQIRTISDKRVLSDQQIKKLRGKWVHVDSEQPTSLSAIIGKAIDQHAQNNFVRLR